MRRWLIIPVMVAAISTLWTFVGCDDSTARVDQGRDRSGSQAVAGDHGTAHEHGVVRSYPLDICLVSGEKLGSMGPPVAGTYHGQQIKFCCEGCVEKFNARPADYLAKLQDASPQPSEAQLREQMASYPMDTCVVMPGHGLGTQAVNYVHADRLIRLCCGECVARFNVDPDRYRAVLDAFAATAAGN